MAASKLPDINTALIKHRNDLVNGYIQKDYTLVRVSISAINALLPEPYKLEINTKKYLQLIEAKNFIFCENCQEDIPRKDIKVMNMEYEPTVQILIQQKERDVWLCPKCEKFADLIGSKFTSEQLQIPYYLKVIPESPVKRGLSDRRSFDWIFGNYVEIAVSELESQIGIYRTDYQAQQSSDGLDEVDETEEE